MQQIFLIPPSEGKNFQNSYTSEKLSFDFQKPEKIAKNATEKDLKCSGKRFEEGISLNKNIGNSGTIEVIQRYSWVMFDAIDYMGMTKNAQDFFDANFLILSGMYGLVKPLDKIGNYKLPIETKWLYDFWGEKIVQKISKLSVQQVINFLPLSYAKLIGANEKPKSQEKLRSVLQEKNIKIINVEFFKDGKKMSHGVKKVKGNFIKHICERGEFDYTKYDFEEKNGMIFVRVEEN